MLDALLAGRGWIVLVGVLLAGIVFFNVDLLQRGRSIASTAERTQQLGRENARLRLELARLASSERVQEEAARQGLLLPAPGDVRYLKLRPSQDARIAAKRVTEPDPTLAAAPQPTPHPAAQAPAATTAAPAQPAPAAAQPAPAAAQPAQPQAQATPPAGTAEPAPTAQAGVGTGGAPAG